MKRCSVKDMNLAHTIIFDSGDFFKIKIDKKDGRIYQIMFCGNDENVDITKDVEAIASKYTIGDMVVDRPYSIGKFLFHALHGTVNNKCIRLFKLWDSMILS